MSSLTISEDKIKHALEQTRPLPLRGVELAGPPALDAQKDQFVISGTISVPPNNEAARNVLLAAFRRIDQNGTVKTEAELNAEMDEMRRRNL